MRSARFELPGAIAPTALLDATDRDRGLAVSSDQDRRIQDAVLLGTAKFLALQEQNAGIALVVHEEVRHGAALADLLDCERPGPDCFVGEQVVDLPIGG